MLKVRSGIDNLQDYDSLLKGKRVGLVTGAAGVDHAVQETIALVSSRYQLTALYAPEHGIRGEIQAGGDVHTYKDAKLGVTVYSIYGKNTKPTPEMLDDIDIMIVDLQEITSRFYTFLYTLAYVMEGCAECGKPVVVLDRATPLGGVEVAGTICEPACISFVGDYELPTRYGLTIGEFARYVNDYKKMNCDLTVAPITGWKRTAFFDETDVPWVFPSPNIPTIDSAFVFAGTCIFEGTNLSEGRGTTKPFELIGAPWLNTDALVDNMAKRGLRGVMLRQTYFKPVFSKHQGEVCAAVQLHITDRNLCEPVRLGLILMDEIRKLHPNEFVFINHNLDGGKKDYGIDRLLGTSTYREGKYDAESLLAAHEPGIEAFRKAKTKFHLYD